MKEEILSNLDNPGQLERLYRADKSSFKRAFNAITPQLSNNTLISYWNERLNFTREEMSLGSSKDLVFVIIASLIAGLIAKLPVILNIDEELFYSRNIGFIVFPTLYAYFGWKNKLSTPKIAFIVGCTLLAVLYINFLPNNKTSDTLVLACIHMVLFLWSILGFAFVGEFYNKEDRRLGFLKYNGDLVVMAALIGIAGGLMTGITIGLFELIGFDIRETYFNYFGIFALSALPIVATWLTRTNPQLVGKVSPVIAKIFSPLVLAMLVIYLVAMAYSGKDPYNDREFLLIFNALLVGVMAIIFFSVAERSRVKSQTEIWILLLLSMATIVVNGIALSAILFRISEWGITPNRAAVLGGNVLILINLLLVTLQLFKVLTKKTNLNSVGKAIAAYLPVYFIWTVIVTFLFPLIFGFK
ncbi:hypothetical protein MD537_02625 [Flavihumibacter sediminis]|nr:hypothetical protein [Flavihumibacter sediminis]